MKKFLLLMLMSVMAITASSCDNDVAADDQKPETEQPDGKSKVLFVYYSWSGVTKGVAAKVREMTGCDVYEIVPAVPYPSGMYETADRADQERESGRLPELAGELPDLSKYDLILVGGPVWSSTLATPLMSYLSRTDFGGKDVAPLWTDAGNEGHYAADFRQQAKNAKLLEGLGLGHASSLGEEELKDTLNDWLKKLGVDAGADRIRITAGDHVINATLNRSEAAAIFKVMLPISISMTRMGEHEYYGRLPKAFEEKGTVQTGYEVGDLAFWTPGDLFALYFDTTDDAPEGLLILGKITSDMNVFDSLGNPEEMRIELINDTEE